MDKKLNPLQKICAANDMLVELGAARPITIRVSRDFFIELMEYAEDPTSLMVIMSTQCIHILVEEWQK